MVRVFFPDRLLLDPKFVLWWREQEVGVRFGIFSKLTHIKSRSQDYKNTHNLILEEDFKDLVENYGLNPKFLMGAAKVVSVPEIHDGTDLLLKRIRFAIDLACKSPYRTCIFTSKEGKADYEGNPHFNAVHTVSARSPDMALRIVDDFYREFRNQQELCRG